VRSAVDSRYLDGDRSNVDLSTSPAADDEWTVEVIGPMTVRLYNETQGGYLSATDRSHRYNVDLAEYAGPAEEWIVNELTNGNYSLENVELGRFLDWDPRNVETSFPLRSDDEWTFELVPPPPPPSPLPFADGDVVHVRSAVDGRYLDADRSNVDLSTSPRADDEWTVVVAGPMTVRLYNETRGGYLSANGRSDRFNVDLASDAGPHEEWTIAHLPNGNYALENVALGRFLDWDPRNVETSFPLRADDEWTFELVSSSY